MGKKEFGNWVEHKSLEIRRRAGVELHLPLKPLDFIRSQGIIVTSPHDLASLSEKSMCQLMIEDAFAWSGLTLKTSRGQFVIILNPMHSPERNNATLMEEYCHIYLGHEPTRIISVNETGVALRTYNKCQENHAYSVGAAVLVPVKPLQAAVENGLAVEEIARHYEVSADLVKFRLKVKGLWEDYTKQRTRR